MTLLKNLDKKTTFAVVMTSETPLYYLVYNPKSGGSNSALDRQKVFSELDGNGIRYTVDDTDDTDTFGKVSRAIDQGHRKFIIVGGDGTMNQAVNAIFKQKRVSPKEILLCLIPFGTGNDWIRSVGIPEDYRRAAKLPATGRLFVQDVGKVTYQGSDGPETHYFANIAGFGYDAFVNRKTNESAAKSNMGKLSYLYTLFRCLLSYRHTQAKITVDGKTVETKLYSGNVGKGRYNGNGMMQVPHAEPTDGEFAVTLIKGISKLGITIETPNLYDGTFVKNNHVETLAGKNVYVESTPPIELECDGESLGFSPFTFELVPMSLHVLVK